MSIDIDKPLRASWPLRQHKKVTQHEESIMKPVYRSVFRDMFFYALGLFTVPLLVSIWMVLFG